MTQQSIVDHLASPVLHRYLLCACCGLLEGSPLPMSVWIAVASALALIPFYLARRSGDRGARGMALWSPRLGFRRGSHAISCASWGAGGGAGV